MSGHWHQNRGITTAGHRHGSLARYRTGRLIHAQVASNRCLASKQHGDGTRSCAGDAGGHASHSDQCRRSPTDRSSNKCTSLRPISERRRWFSAIFRCRSASKFDMVGGSARASRGLSLDAATGARTTANAELPSLLTRSSACCSYREWSRQGETFKMRVGRAVNYQIRGNLYH